MKDVFFELFFGPDFFFSKKKIPRISCGFPGLWFHVPANSTQVLQWNYVLRSNDSYSLICPSSFLWVSALPSEVFLPPAYLLTLAPARPYFKFIGPFFEASGSH